MSTLKKLTLVTLLLLTVLLLSGCTDMNAPIEPSSGIWDKYFVYPLHWLIHEAKALLFNNYALAILAVTIVVRLLTLPLMIKQIRTSKLMQLLQPEITKIRDKYKDNREKLQLETMKLFQKYNVNPLSGCFPILVQMPILLALYHAIIRDPIFNPEMENHTDEIATFLWLKLGEVDPYFIIPVVAGLTTFLQTKMMGTDFSQNPQMKVFLYAMPIMIFWFATQFPSALGLYWIYGNLFTIVQTYFMNRNLVDLKLEVKK